MTKLDVTGLTVNYGAVRAVRGVSLTVTTGEILVVLGSNGAGKSSSLRAIAGLIPSGGTATWDGADISKWSAHKRARSGLALVPEGRRVFSPLTVEENLLLGAYGVRPTRLRTERMDSVYALFPRLHERRASHSGLLSGGEQQMLAIGRALMAGPQIILMDEPSMGLAPTVVDTVMDSVKAIAETGVGVVMVEQNAVAGLEIAGRAAVLDRGVVVAEGGAAQLREDPTVLRAFLGAEAVADVVPAVTNRGDAPASAS